MVFTGFDGVLRKHSDILFNVSYDEIEELSLVDKFKLNISHKSQAHKLETTDESAAYILKQIEKMKTR